MRDYCAEFMSDKPDNYRLPPITKNQRIQNLMDGIAMYRRAAEMAATDSEKAINEERANVRQKVLDALLQEAA